MPKHILLPLNHFTDIEDNHFWYLKIIMEY